MKQPKPIIFTKAGFESLKQKSEQLTTERISAVEQLKKARDMGDLSENGFYKAAKAKLSSIDHQLMVTRHHLRYGVIRDSKGSELVEVGSSLTIDDGAEQKNITIVGEQEANPSIGHISFRSPLGKGLIGKKQGDKASIETPRGEKIFTIIAIR